MSRWDGWGWYPKPPPKRPPPERGIKVKKIGATWWGQRWIEALEKLSWEYSSRLARGRTYARAGRVHDLEVGPGKVTAYVTGSRPTPYKVTLRIAALGAAAWEKAVAEMAKQALFAAELLAGQMRTCASASSHPRRPRRFSASSARRRRGRSTRRLLSCSGRSTRQRAPSRGSWRCGPLTRPRCRSVRHEARERPD